MQALDNACIYLSIRAMKAKERFVDFWRSQDGVSNVVATIIILLIVVLIIGVFWNRLSGWLNDLMDKVFNSAEPTTKAPDEL